MVAYVTRLSAEILRRCIDMLDLRLAVISVLKMQFLVGNRLQLGLESKENGAY